MRTFNKMLKFAQLFQIFFFLLSAAHAIVINEVMSINNSTIADEDADYPDWIELYNSDTESVDLSGFGLSDDPMAPFKWVMPSVTLPPKDFLLIFASDKDRRDVFFWNTVINRGDAWRYRLGDNQVPLSWNQLDFDDSDWSEGPSGFGYSDGDDATVVSNTVSLLARKKFFIEDHKNISRLLLHVDYDDAFVAYINGQEVARSNIGRPGEIIAFDRLADAGHEAVMYQGHPPELFEINDVLVLRDGDNVLAMQVHNVSTGSSDMSLIPFLTSGSENPQSGATTPAILNLPNAFLHTNFKIKGNGETLLLVDTSGTRVDTVKTPSLPQDVSWGRFPDGADSWHIFALPSPAEANIDSAYIAPAAAPVFLRPGGLYDAPIRVELADTAGGDIYYTLDGSVPDQTDFYYTEPIRLSETACIRARSFFSSLEPSRVLTHTYVFNEYTEFAIVALTSDPLNLYDYNYGIFADGPNAGNDYPYFGANFWQDWERPVHVEFFEPSGALGFALDAGMKVFGGWSRGRDQKSLAIFQRGKYDTRQIDYQIFPQKEIYSFESFLLRNGGNDWTDTMFRDAFMQTLCAEEMDLETMAYRPAHVYLNGGYWGILILREKINEHFVASNRGIDPDRVDILDGSGFSSGQVMAGSNKDYVDLWQFIENHDLSVHENYVHVASRMDISNFIDYQIAEIFIANTDWPGNNIKYYKPQTPGGRWRWLIYDTDFGFHLYGDSYSHNTLEFATEPDGQGWPNPPWSTFLLRSLLENKDFTRQFIKRFADHLNTTFSVDRIVSILQKFDALFGPEIDRQRNRWPGSVGRYHSSLQRMYRFADRRDLYVRSAIRNMFQLKSDIAIELNVQPKDAGFFKINSKSIGDFPWQGAYFHGIPVTLTAIPQPGFRFDRWDNLNGAASTTFDAQADLTVTAIFRDDEPARMQIVINEINYNSGENFPAKDWLELYNAGDVTIDLAGWQIRDAVREHLFAIPDHAMAPASGYAILCTDTTHFNFVYSDVPNVFGDLPFNLSNGGDSLYLIDPSGQVVDSIFFDDDQPWPNADGTGYTLELRDPLSDNLLPDNWATSAFIGGTPGRRNSAITAVEKAQKMPTLFYLGENYPNPFNGETIIPYHLAASADVKISIHDLLGREVAVLLQKRQNAGRHQISWKTNEPTGIYLCRMEIQTNATVVRRVQKMLLVK